MLATEAHSVHAHAFINIIVLAMCLETHPCFNTSCVLCVTVLRRHVPGGARHGHVRGLLGKRGGQE